MADKTWSECKQTLIDLGCNTDDSMALTVMTYETVLTYEIRPLIFASIVIGADKQAEIAVMKHLIDFIRRLQDDDKIHPYTFSKD